MKEIKISLKKQAEYMQGGYSIKLDKEWSRKDLGEKKNKKGVYIIFATPKEIIYVGKTREKKMDFATRLYRHIHKGASSSSRVYKKLKEINNKGLNIEVSLIDTLEINKYFFFQCRKV